jgi:hypothetical protein
LVRITELLWPDGGQSFEVHRVDTDTDLTEHECFDAMPTDEQIAILLDQHTTPTAAAVQPGHDVRPPQEGTRTGMTPPAIRRWLTPAGFAAAVPALATYPLPVLSHALARLRTTAVAALAAPHSDEDTDGTAVYLVAPSYVLLVDATGYGGVRRPQQDGHNCPHRFDGCGATAITLSHARPAGRLRITTIRMPRESRRMRMQIEDNQFHATLRLQVATVITVRPKSDRTASILLVVSLSTVVSRSCS